MVVGMAGVCTRIVYQPFLTLLVAIYIVLDYHTNGNADMGFAIIIFTIALRFFLLPLSLASELTEAERHDIKKR